jgi:hypothetical protein
VSDRRKFVRSFSLDGPHSGGAYGWYIAKKAAFLAAVLIIVLLTYAWLPRNPMWVSLGVPALITVAGFALGGRITIGGNDATAGKEPPRADPPKAPSDPNRTQPSDFAR